MRNRFMTRRLQRLFNAFISCLLAGLMCMACTVRTPTSSQAASPTPMPQNTAPTGTIEQPDWLSQVDFSQHLTVSIGFWEIAGVLDQSANDQVLRQIESLFHITVQPVSVSWSNYTERYPIMAATGQLPDVFATTLVSSPSYVRWARDGVIRAIPEDLSRFPELSSIMALPDIINLKIDGSFYMIPRVSFLDRDLYASDAALIVRRDWMENLGIAIPANFSEFAEMLRRFAADDPDGNGVNDTAGLSVNARAALGKWVLLGVQPSCNVYGWIDYGGQFQPCYMTPLFDDVVRAFRMLYRLGALDPDFSTQQADDATDKFARGKLGALEYKSSPGPLLALETRWNHYQDPGSFTDKVMILPVFPAPDGQRYHNTGRFFWSESYFAGHVDDVKMTRLLCLYEYLMSEEGRLLLMLGIEGQDYVWRQNQTVDIIRPLDSANGRPAMIRSLYPSIAIFGSLARWTDDMRMGGFIPNEINNANYGEAIMRMSYDDLIWNLQHTLPVERPFAFLALFQQEAYNFPTARIIDDLTAVILGQIDPVVLWQEVQTRYLADGMQELIDDMNGKAASNRVYPYSSP
jgi:ABC-type glycerol-3-phosphate transport system substrate-binding protein